MGGSGRLRRTPPDRWNYFVPRYVLALTAIYVPAWKAESMNHRISCAETLLRLDDFVDRALSPADQELVQEHLLECVRCTGKFRFEVSLVEALRARLSRIEAPEALLQTIRQRLEVETRQ
jgi:Putative zinc-finger